MIAETKNEAPHHLESMFHPRSIAVAGASEDPRNDGNRYLRQLIEAGYRGLLHAVNPKGGLVLGRPAHKSVRDITEEVDCVVSCVPAPALEALVDDCIAKGVRHIFCYTARLAETGEEERRQAEARIAAKVKAAGVRLVGPNCMGVYYPAGGLTFRFSFPRESGRVGFISQSGGNSVELAYSGSGRGLRFSKIVSYGNGADVNETELLDYFLHDEETSIIALYIEGVRDPARFFATLRRAAAAKPLAVMKGGRGAAGSRAARTHTASMAGENRLWEAACRQAGAIWVYTVEELADVLLALTFLPLARGPRVAVLGGGGGAVVSAADLCEAEGLIVPPLPEDALAKLQGLARDRLSLLGNPLDESVMGGPSDLYRTLCRLLSESPDIDVLIGRVTADWHLDERAGQARLAQAADTYVELSRGSGKPVAVVLGASDSTESWRWGVVAELQDRCRRARLPVYPSFQRAARALGHFVRHSIAQPRV